MKHNQNTLVNPNTTHFWDRLLDNRTYLNEYGVSDRVRISKIARVLKGSVLNVGSGQGYLERHVNKYHDSWYSLDISFNGLQKLSSRFNRIQGMAQALPFKSNSFDTVVISEVIEHMTKVEMTIVFNELRRVVKPEGLIVITAPVFEPRSLKNHPVGHLQKFTKDTFIDLLKNSGVRMIKIEDIYGFRNLYSLKSVLSKKLNLRRPSVMFAICTL